jgi:hypothetical protein
MSLGGTKPDLPSARHKKNHQRELFRTDRRPVTKHALNSRRGRWKLSSVFNHKIDDQPKKMLPIPRSHGRSYSMLRIHVMSKLGLV